MATDEANVIGQTKV